MNKKLFVNNDIRIAETLSSDFYTDDNFFEESKEKIFSRCWQFAGDRDIVRVPGQVSPVMLYEDFINEPIIFIRDFDDRINCLSNVCTHRGNILVEGNCNERQLRCRYHGRKFDLKGKFVSMPEFDNAANFPSPKDDLPVIPFDSWEKFLFASIRPVGSMQSFIDEMIGITSRLKIEDMKYEPSGSKDYLVKCHWALYCENYLEGFHIPFVHSGLNEVLDYSGYRTELFPFSSLQIGISKNNEGIFDLPKDHRFAGSNISAFYFWIFPNMMFNFYPWGLSINIVKPLKKDLTRVSFLRYVLDESKLDQGAGAGIDKVEREDEAIVENVQKGIRSHFYESGRYSPSRETGVHHFHRLICDFMN